MEQCLQSGCQTYYFVCRPYHYRWVSPCWETEGWATAMRNTFTSKNTLTHSVLEERKREQTASVCHWLTPFWREPKWRESEREIERGLPVVGKRVSYWPVMQCGRAEWWRVECWCDCFYSSSLACLITKLCRLSRSRPPLCSSPCAPALKIIKVG